MKLKEKEVKEILNDNLYDLLLNGLSNKITNFILNFKSMDEIIQQYNKSYDKYYITKFMSTLESNNILRVYEGDVTKSNIFVINPNFIDFDYKEVDNDLVEFINNIFTFNVTTLDDNVLRFKKEIKNKGKENGLYVLLNRDNNLVKIGVIDNIENRINTFKRNFEHLGIKYNCDLVYYICSVDKFKFESHLHNVFKNYKHLNEWFNIDYLKVIGYIECVKDNFIIKY